MNRRILGIPACDWCWLLGLGLIRVLIALRYGLGVDEAHYALYGVHLDWSYFDHPPLVGWIQAIFMRLFGHHDWGVHLPAEILGVVAGAQAYRLGEKLTGDLKAARWAALALSVSFLPNGLWFMLVPDTILLVLILWLVEVVMRLHENRYQRLREWISFGLALGLCGLTKYTAVILLPGLVGFILGERSIFRSFDRQQMQRFIFGFIAAVLVACIVVAPVFYWNATHQWISFQYQILHVVHAHQVGLFGRLRKLSAFLAVQFVAYSPFVIAAAAIGWLMRPDLAPERARLILWLSLPCLLFFAYSGSREAGLPHWTFYAWGLLLPSGVALGVKHAPARGRMVRSIKTLVSVSGVLVGVLLFELAFHVIRYPAYHSAYNDFAGWSELRPVIRNILAGQNGREVAIGVPNWTLGSRANWYYGDLAPVYVLQNKLDQFKLWEKTPPTGRDILILEWRGFAVSPAQKAQCASIEPVTSRTFYEHNSPITSVDLWWCRKYGLRGAQGKNTSPKVTK